MIHYEFDQKPLMSLSDVQCQLPVHEDVWEKFNHMQPSEGKTSPGWCPGLIVTVQAPVCANAIQ
jgi:hypothetical protein